MNNELTFAPSAAVEHDDYVNEYSYYSFVLLLRLLAGAARGVTARSLLQSARTMMRRAAGEEALALQRQPHR